MNVWDMTSVRGTEFDEGIGNLAGGRGDRGHVYKRTAAVIRGLPRAMSAPNSSHARKLVNKASKAVMKSHRVSLPKYNLPIRLRPVRPLYRRCLSLALTPLCSGSYSSPLPSCSSLLSSDSQTSPAPYHSTTSFSTSLASALPRACSTSSST